TDYLQLLFFASLASMLSLFLVIVIRRKCKLLFNLSRRNLLYSALLGLINPTLYYIVLFKAYSLLPAQEAQPLNWIWPITLSLLSVPLLKQRLRSGTIIALILGFCGVVIISTKGSFSAMQLTNLTGDILAVGSSVLWALYWIFSLKDQRDPVIRLFYCFLFGSIYSLVIVVLFSDFQSVSLKGLALAGYVGMFEMGFTFVIWFKALSLAKDNASVGILAYITPFISLIFIHYVLGERILLSSVAGLMLIVGGILIQVFSGNRRINIKPL
ncbi:MAG: DMT family transporter, partial [Calditrichaeota bacterium]|nr:DMT family transporter [Calditrichota bacterium]